MLRFRNSEAAVIFLPLITPLKEGLSFNCLSAPSARCEPRPEQWIPLCSGKGGKFKEVEIGGKAALTWEKGNAYTDLVGKS
jgi:hypothetical protein